MSKATIKIAFIANQEEFDELTRHQFAVYHPKYSYSREPFNFDGPKHYLYQKYYEDRNCRCRGCQDEIIYFITNENEINKIIKSLNEDKADIDKRIESVEKN